ncbi:probable thiopurine S-methyltransferase [Trichomycterus rosablanca]|uniref:probable thiopurine S-methyltransferase n=1 Tax=Trichomycterus rosablanca TaxID=2290929 RepID=UPI002F356FD6
MAAQTDRVMALSEWEEKWQEGRIAFHQHDVHPMLKSNIDKLLCGRQQVRFFFPLCGKAVDMKWLADMGHTVVGVEISEKAIKQFFEEHGLKVKEETVPSIPGTKVFKSPDGKISIYQCDLYKFSSAKEGQFGGIWDRGSLVAINPCDRQKYANLIMSLIDKDCRYLLDTMEYDPERHKGPPFFVPEEVVKNLYGEAFDIELLQTADAFEERHKAWGIDSLTEKVYLLTPKPK